MDYQLRTNTKCFLIHRTLSFPIILWLSLRGLLTCSKWNGRIGLLQTVAPNSINDCEEGLFLSDVQGNQKPALIWPPSLLFIQSTQCAPHARPRQPLHRIENNSHQNNMTGMTTHNSIPKPHCLIVSWLEGTVWTVSISVVRFMYPEHSAQVT